MFQLKENHIKQFQRRPEMQYIESMDRYLSTCYSNTYESLGPTSVNGRIKHGMEKSKLYNFTQNSEMSMFVELVFFWGCDFEIDETWATKIIGELGDSSPDTVIESLYESGMRYLDHDD